MNKRFAIGFSIGLFSFIMINLFAAHLASDCGLLAIFGRDACADDIARAGWPLQFYEEGGFAYHRNFSLPFLLINSTIAVVFAVLLGWILSHSKKLLLK
jgi:hypothetical protein